MSNLTVQLTAEAAPCKNCGKPTKWSDGYCNWDCEKAQRGIGTTETGAAPAVSPATGAPAANAVPSSTKPASDSPPKGALSYPLDQVTKGGYESGSYSSGGSYSYGGYGGKITSSYKSCKHKGDPIAVGKYTIYAAARRDVGPKDLQDYDIVMPLTSSITTSDFNGVFGLILLFPIVDMQAPDVKLLRVQAERLVRFLKDGNRIVVFCEGSHGRTGLVLATVLGLLEPEIEDPVTELRARHCKDAVETYAQVEIVFKALGRPLPEVWRKAMGPAPKWQQQGKYWSSTTEKSYSKGLDSKHCDYCHYEAGAKDPLHWYGATRAHYDCYQTAAAEAQAAKKAAKGDTTSQKSSTSEKKKSRHKVKQDAKRLKNSKNRKDSGGALCGYCAGGLFPDQHLTFERGVAFHDDCHEKAWDLEVLDYYADLAGRNYKERVTNTGIVHAWSTAEWYDSLPDKIRNEVSVKDGHPVVNNEIVCECKHGAAPCIVDATPIDLSDLGPLNISEGDIVVETPTVEATAPKPEEPKDPETKPPAEGWDFYD